MRKRMLALLLTFVMAVGLLPAAALAENTAVSSIQLGDYVQVGKYNGYPIPWRCVAFEKVTGTDANGNPIIDSTDTKTAYEDGYLPLMLADIAICSKGFDHRGNVTTGSHGRHGDRYSGGSNYWGDSNIRDWLNSSADSVTWSCGNSPKYANEKGFLTNFTNAEKAAIKTVTQKSLLAELDKDISGAMGSAAHTYGYEITDFVKNYADAYSEQITDGMFLLDVQQLKNVYVNLGDYYKLSSDYWLRSPEGDGHSYVRDVTASGIVGRDTAYSDELVRPAFFLDPAAALDGEGTKAAPYTLAAPAPTPAHTHAVSVGCETDSGDQVEFTEWKSGGFNGTFPSAPGNYALTEDVEIRSDTWTISSGVVNLCLNGHTLNMTNGGYILLNDSDAKLNICDCSEHGSGSIKSVSSNLHAEAISITHSKSTLNLYGGNICAEFNGTGTAGSYAYGVNTSAAPVNIYGGTVTAKSSASKAIALNVTSSGPKVSISDGVLTAQAPEGQDAYGLYGLHVDSQLSDTYSISISGGVFIAEKSIGLKATPEGRPINATGGIYSTDPTGVIAPSYTARKIKTTDAGYKAEYAGYYILEPASVQPAHTHAVSVGCETTSGTQVTFRALTSENDALYVDGAAAEVNSTYKAYVLPAGNYYLAGDVRLNKQIRLTKQAQGADTANSTVNFCLNGYKLEYAGDDNRSPVIYVGTNTYALNICDCNPTGTDRTGNVINDPVSGYTKVIWGGVITGGRYAGVTGGNAPVTLYGGAIAGNGWATESIPVYGGGINADNFAMHGGAIMYNMATYGGGVNATGSFTMTGGTISDNWAKTKNGGVHTVISSGTPTSVALSGGAKITGNVMGEKQTPSNLNLVKDSVVTVAPEGLDGNFQVGISTSGTPTQASPVTVATPGAGYTITADDLAKFSSDDSAYELKLSNGKIVLAVKPAAHVHSWATAWTTSDTHHWHECNASGCDIVDYANCGETGAAYEAHTTQYDYNEWTHWQVCTVCGNFDRDMDTEENHVYDDDADTTCNTCGYEREIQTFEISGKVTDHADSAVSGATVRLMQGSTQIGQSVTTDQQGNYSFVGVAPGLYNVVATKDNITKTILVEITSQNATNQNIKMPDGKKNSVVEVTGADTPAVVVGGVDEIAEAQAVSPDETVTVKLTVEKKEESAAANATEIKQVASGKTVEFLDLKLEKIVTGGTNDGTTNITDTKGKVLEIVVPYDFSGKTAVTVYRYHDGRAEALTQGGSKAGGTFRLGTDSVTIYATKFSTYAIGYTAASQTTYTLTVNGGTGSGSYAAGTTINISATVPSGKRFTGWTGATVANPGSTNTTLVMPAQDTTVTANFQNISNGGGGGGPTTYPVETPSADGGKVTVSPKSAASGTTVTLTLTPDQSYTISGVTVTDRNGKQIAVTDKGDGKYTFIMPSGKVTVHAKFIKITDGYKNCPRDSTCPIWPYTDTNLAAWYHDGIHFCVENGLMNGCGNGKFGPNDNLTRAQFVQILHNREGRPVVNYLLRFEDVPNGAWYTEAVRWAAGQGVVSGYGNGKFGPNDPVTREQLAVILWRYVGSPAATEQELHFTDADKASGYALEALRWTVENGIINGYGNGQLDPQGPATRAQMAQILKSFFT